MNREEINRRQNEERKCQRHTRTLRNYYRAVLVDGWYVAIVNGDPIDVRLARLKTYALLAEQRLPLFPDGVRLNEKIKPIRWIRVVKLRKSR